MKSSGDIIVSLSKNVEIFMEDSRNKVPFHQENTGPEKCLRKVYLSSEFSQPILTIFLSSLFITILINKHFHCLWAEDLTVDTSHLCTSIITLTVDYNSKIIRTIKYVRTQKKTPCSFR